MHPKTGLILVSNIIWRFCVVSCLCFVGFISLYQLHSSQDLAAKVFSIRFCSNIWCFYECARTHTHTHTHTYTHTHTHSFICCVKGLDSISERVAAALLSEPLSVMSKSLFLQGHCFIFLSFCHVLLSLLVHHSGRLMELSVMIYLSSNFVFWVIACAKLVTLLLYSIFFLVANVVWYCC